MKIKVLQENLNQSLGYLQKAIPGKPQLPILASVLIQVTKNECTLSATDLYLGVQANVQVEADEEGDIVVPGKEFKEIIASLPPGVLTLDYSEGKLKISSAKTKTSLQCHNSDEYPPFPQVQGEEYVLSKDYLEKIEKYVSFSASTDQARPVLTTVLFSFGDQGLQVVSTDGFRLALMKFDSNQKVGSSENQENSQLLVPAKALNEVFRIMSQVGEDEVRFKVSHELKQVFFAVGEVQIFVRLIEGSYPPYEKIIPSSLSTEVDFDKEELINNIKRAMIFARETSNIVRFAFSDNGVEILASSPSLGTFSGELSRAKVKGGSAEIAFNARYLLDFLQAVEGEIVSFGMTDSLKPASFGVPELLNYQYIVMPFKVNT